MSKNPGGTKRVTSLADALKLNFGMVTTDRRRAYMNGSSILEASGFLGGISDGAFDIAHSNPAEIEAESQIDPVDGSDVMEPYRNTPGSRPHINGTAAPSNLPPLRQLNNINGSSPLAHSTQFDPTSPPRSVPWTSGPQHTADAGPPTGPGHSNDVSEEYTDERAREVITGRLIQGHIVDDDFPSPLLSTMSGSIATLPDNNIGSSQFDNQAQDPMGSSMISTLSTFPSDHALGGTFDAKAESEDDEEGLRNPELEHTVTLVGNVKDRVVLIIDDLIDQCGSWIAAAETVVKRGSAKRVYCIATHGLFGGDSLEQMEQCECIDYIVVTNSYPIAPERARDCKKLVILDISNLLSEAIRRNHYGESISALFQHYQD